MSVLQVRIFGLPLFYGDSASPRRPLDDQCAGTPHRADRH